jgi:hypothetical protein
MTRCPCCGSELERRYEIECASAIRGLWKPRLRCSNSDCGAAGLHDPVTSRWISFNDLATRPQLTPGNHGFRAPGNGNGRGCAQGSA